MSRKSKELASAESRAWLIHTALTDWTGKVDAKASFAFAIQSAALVTMVALTASHRLFEDMSVAVADALYWAGVMGFLAAIVLSTLVVVPRLRGGVLSSETANNFIYFGHLRHWKSERLESQLLSGEILPALSQQLVVMSKIAWRKHRLVQVSIWLTLASGLAVLTAGLIIGITDAGMKP